MGTSKKKFIWNDPQGMSDIEKYDCIILSKCISYKKAIKILKNLGFIGGSVPPCLYMKKSAKGVVYIALYVDDDLMVGDMMAIDDAIAALKSNRLVLKVREGLQDCLSYDIKFSKDKNRAWLGQPQLVKNLEKIWRACARSLESQNSRYT